MKYLVIFIIAVLLISCKEKSTLQVKNLLPKAVIKNVAWGNIAVSDKVLPGQTSDNIILYDSESNYGVDLPASYPLKFYIELNGDLIFVQTRKLYRLNSDQDLEIVVCDTTRVFNPLIEEEN